MERESFEDEEVADKLNKDFVSIKVDREERPDVDHIYMTVCQALTGSGGWPLSIFLTPDKEPFFAGTYFPKSDRMGYSGFLTLLDKISDAWKSNKDALMKSGKKIINIISKPDNSMETASIDTIHDAFSHFKNYFDSVYGGFGSAPKFPTPHNLFFLLRYWYTTKEPYALEMVEKTLDSMYRGGIYDHIGFGFSRYSTDKKWLVPHFEKMLYDNALLAIAYLEAYQVTGKEKYARTAREIFTYVLRDMTSPEGGFYSAEDADSEGIEGKFYLWSVNEILDVLGKEDGSKFCNYYSITPSGNFEGLNIPNLIKDDIPDAERSFTDAAGKKLYDHREKRIHPYKDDKVLTAWNGLMIAAMSIGGKVLGESKYTLAAENALHFILSKLVGNNGRLMARYRDRDSAYAAYVDDYAFLVWGLVELYESTYKAEYLENALKLNDDLIKLFWDEKNGGLYIYGSDSEQLITRPKEVYDGATPSGNSVSALNFLRLARLTGRHDLEEKAQQMFKTFGSNLKNSPWAHTFLLTAFLFAYSDTKEVIVVSKTFSDNTDELLNVIKEKFMPFTLTMVYSEENENLKKIVPFIENYSMIDKKATAYVCENFSCMSPITDVNQFRQILLQ